MLTIGLVGVLVLGVWCLGLSVVDVRERRLPNLMTLPGAVVVFGYAAVVGQWRAAIVGGVLLAAVYLVVHLAAPEALGAGDVKLALGLGGAAAMAGADAWVLAALLAPVGTAVAGLVLIVRQRPDRAVPHGPFMCGATLLAIAM